MADVITRFKVDTNEYNRKVGQAKDRLDKFGLSGRQAKGSLDLLTGSVLKFTAQIGIATSAAGLFKEALSNNVQTALQFEKSMSTLSSLTGMAGKDLDTLKAKAIELGSTTTQSASQVADAFALIGSKRPDLLSSAYALGDVTKAAITMSEAAGITVPEAADSLSAALNIFNMESSEANRVINVLAAGSKLGAAGIQELGDMVFRAGGSAKKAGLSFEEFAGAAEIIRPAFGTAEDAGQAFNKFHMKLEEKMDSQYKPSVVGFEQAMKNLKKANLDSNESLKIFTINGVKAYDAIMQNVDGLGKMIKGVTGTNTATEQAKKNTDNLDGSLKQLSSAWEGLNLSINSSNGLLKDCVDWLAKVVQNANEAFTELGKVQKKQRELNGGDENGVGSRISKELSAVRGSNFREEKIRAISGQYDQQIADLMKKIQQRQSTVSSFIEGGDVKRWKAEIEALRKLKDEFRSRALAIGKPGKTGGGAGGGTEEENDYTSSTASTRKLTPTEQALISAGNAFGQMQRQIGSDFFMDMNDMKKGVILDNNIAEAVKEGTLEAMEKIMGYNPERETPSFDSKKTKYKESLIPEEKKGLFPLPDWWNGVANDIGDMTNLLGGIQSDFNTLGIDLGEGFTKVLASMQIITTILSVIEALQSVKSIPIIGEFMHSGGVVHAAQGVFVPGTPNGGRDTVPAMLSPGELVLNAAQQNSLAAQLSSGSISNLHLETVIAGENLRVVLCNNDRRRGRSEHVISKTR